MNKSDKKVTKAIEEVKEIPSNPLPDITTAAEYIRKRRIK
jgi:hypothetical protein